MAVMSRILLLISIFAMPATIVHAMFQDSPDSAQPRIDADETVVVTGVPLGQLRTMIEEAEEDLYARFNEINSDDKFDIYCYHRRELGSRMLRRRCLPNYWRDASEEIGEETARAMQSGGGPAFNPQVAMAQAHYNGLLLSQEMRQLTAEDEELMAATVRLANLQQMLNINMDIRRAANETAARSVLPGEDAIAAEADADAVYEVRMGRQSWRHPLTSRTFTIARVYGEIDEIRVECDQQKLELEYEIGVDWTLPDDWRACSVVVDADRDTTFALYEFD